MITWFIIGTTVLISYLAFQNPDLASKLQFNAAQIIHRKEYYRLVSHAFIHANWTHLLINMMVKQIILIDMEIKGEDYSVSYDSSIHTATFQLCLAW